MILPDRGPLRRMLVVAGCCAGLFACTTAPTPYQAQDDRYGYTEQQIEDDRYRVTFAGNAATPRETVRNYMLYRAAELTVASGHDYFTVVDQQVEGRGDGTATPRVGLGVGSGGYGGSNVGLGVGISTFLGGSDDARYTAFADIVMGDGEKPIDVPNAYDAREILERLGPEVTGPAA